MAVAVHYAARSELGLGPKSRNEDSAYAGPHLLVLADGMGGHAAGDVASSMIVGVLAPLDEDVPGADLALATLDGAMRDANAALSRAMADNPDLLGMGSTTVALLRTGNKIAMAHIGDSRGYLLRDGKVAQITKDHSFVQGLVDEGRITREDADTHPQRFLVTRVMTGMPDDEPDLSMREALPGDRYLLCSDGLSDYVRGDIIEEILTSATSPQAAADKLIEVALKASTRDNVTVVVADIVDIDTAEPPPTMPLIVGAAAQRPRSGSRTRGLPVSPAEKAAALSREASGRAADEALDDDHDGPPDTVTLAETHASPFQRWAKRLSPVVALALLATVALFGYRWTQDQYFVGVDGDRVAVYRGVPQDVGPWSLHEVRQTSDVLLADLPGQTQDALRRTVTATDPGDAERKVAMLRDEAVRCRQQRDAGQQCVPSEPLFPAIPGATTPGATPGGPGTDTGTTGPGGNTSGPGATGIPGTTGIPATTPARPAGGGIPLLPLPAFPAGTLS